MGATAYLTWEATQERKHELHRGFVLDIAGGTRAHDRISFNVRSLLERMFPAPCETFGSEIKLQVSADTYYYPDAGVVCDEIADDATVITTARIVVEVLSPSTRAYDLIEKRSTYRAMPDLRAYVIVHAQSRRVEVDARNRSGSWETATYDSDEAFIDGRSIQLNDIYDRVNLPSRE